MTNNNNIPKGYKQTKLGVIPEDWILVSLNDTKSKEKWSITGGPFGSNLKVSDYVEQGGVRVLQLQNIGDGKFNDKSVIRTSIAKADELLSCNIYPNDIIISKMGDPVARACFIPEIEARYVMASDGIRLKIDESEWDSKYVLDLINSPNVRNIAKRWAIGSTRQRIGLDDLRKLPFCKPPLPEQKAIAKILSTWDKAIETQTALIDKKKLYKKALMQKLLKPKEDWREVRLGEVVSYLGGGAFKSNDQTDEGVKWLKIANVGVSKTKWEVITYLPFNFVEEFSRYLLQIDDIVLALTRPILNNQLKIAIIKDNDISLLNQRVAKIIPQDNVNGLFIYYVHQLPIIVYLMNAMMAGTDPPNIGIKDLGSIKINIPNLQTQTKIANILSSADKEISILEQQLVKLKEQKRGLMQVLLTGKKRVKLENN